jgi:hypothetical protein
MNDKAPPPIEITSIDDFQNPYLKDLYENRYHACAKRVPYSAIKEKLDNNEYILADSDRSIARMASVGMPHWASGAKYPYNKLLDNIEIYDFAKFNWLYNELTTGPMLYPVQCCYIDPDIETGKHVIMFHPGSIKIKVLEFINKPFDVILWDTYNEFSEYPRMSYEEWYNDVPIMNSTEGITQIHQTDRSLEVWVASGGINNFRKLGVQNRYVTLQKHIDPDVKIFIGYDSSHKNSAEVCRHSIRKYNSWVNIELLDISKIPEYNRDWNAQTTEFTYSRFLVPYLMNYKGIGIFCDDDFIWQCDPLELLFTIHEKFSVNVVKHEFVKDLSAIKLGDQQNVMYPKKLWSSLMLFNNAHNHCKGLTPDVVNSETGSYLHQLKWTTDECIGTIPHTYNWCEDSCNFCKLTYNKMENAKAIHYTRGGPWIQKDLEWDHIENLSLWKQIEKDYLNE